MIGLGIWSVRMKIRIISHFFGCVAQRDVTGIILDVEPNKRWASIYAVSTQIAIIKY